MAIKRTQSSTPNQPPVAPQQSHQAASTPSQGKLSSAPRGDLKATPGFKLTPTGSGFDVPATSADPEFSDLRQQFKDCVSNSLVVATQQIDQIWSDIKPAPSSGTSLQCTSKNRHTFSQTAATFATGAFNQVSNNAMIGNGYTAEYLPDAHLTGNTLDLQKLAHFHTNMMDKLLTRLSGLEMKLRLHDHGLLNVRDAQLNLSHLQKNRLGHFGRTLATKTTHRFNAFVIRQLRISVLKQIRNESKRAGEGAFQTTKASILKHYGDDEQVKAIFDNKSPLMASMNAFAQAAAPQLSNINAPDNHNKLTARLPQKTAMPDMRESLATLNSRMKQPRLSKLEPFTDEVFQERPRTHGLVAKAFAAHQMTYGLQTKSLDQHVADATHNRQLIDKLQALQATTEDTRATLKNKDIKSLSKEEKATHTFTFNNLDYKLKVIGIRLTKAEKAYTASAKEVVRSTSPSKFEQKIAEKGFHSSNDRSSPNPFLTGTTSNTLRARLLSHTYAKALALPNKSALKTEILTALKDEKIVHTNDKMSRANIEDVFKLPKSKYPELYTRALDYKHQKTLIKINAALVHAPQNPEKSFHKLIKLLQEDAKITARSPKELQNSLALFEQLKDLKSLMATMKSQLKAETSHQDTRTTLDEKAKLVETVIQNASLDQSTKETIMSLFGTQTEGRGRAIDIEGLVTGNTRTALVMSELQDAKEDYRAVFKPLNDLMKHYIEAPESGQKTELQPLIQTEIFKLMGSSDLGDELTGTYNTLVGSLNRMIGDTQKGDDAAVSATHALRHTIPPIASATGGMLLESSKVKASEAMANNMVALLDVISTPLEGTSLKDQLNELTRTQAVSDTSKVQDLLRARALMKKSNTLEQVKTTFAEASNGIHHTGNAKYQTAVHTLHRTIDTALQSDTLDTKKLKQDLTAMYSSLYQQLNTIQDVKIKPNSTFWIPGANTNERSIKHHVDILASAVETLHSQSKSNKAGASADSPQITPKAITQTLLNYLQGDLEHHFRRSDLETVHMRDRMLWGQESPSTMASSTILATAIGDLDEQGNGRGVDDPHSILGELQRDFNRTVNMPAQIITQGVVNAALVGSAFGSVPAMAINPMLMVTPTPFPFLNGGDFISMSTFGASAALPLSIVSGFKSKHNLKTEATAATDFVTENAKENGTKESTPDAATPVTTFPKQYHTRNSFNRSVLQKIDWVAEHWLQQKPTSERPGHFQSSSQPLDIPGHRQVGRILNETRRMIGEDVLAQAALGTVEGVKLGWKMMKNDLFPVNKNHSHTAISSKLKNTSKLGALKPLGDPAAAFVPRCRGIDQDVIGKHLNSFSI